MTTLLRGLPELPHSIQLPAHLFSLFVSTLDITKGAILLPDYDENLFVPWASVGIDMTTLHRLRIPDEDVNVMRSRGPAGIVWEGDEVRDFSPYFSRREASQLDRLLLFPIVNGAGTQALLMLTETPYLGGQLEFLRMILAAVGEPAAQVIERERLRYSDVIRHSVVFRIDELEPVTERVAERAPEGVTLVLLDLADVVAPIASSNEHLDAYRVWQDLLRIIASLFAATGTVVDLDRNKVLLCLHGARDQNLSLLIHHVGATIAHLLPEVEEVPQIGIETREYPSDGEDLLGLARSFI